jgi:membrane protein DedA with SNARE-associated domain
LGAFVAIAVAGTLGYLLGAIVGWVIGYYGGRPFLARRGSWFHLDQQKVDRAERWFARWEYWAVLVGRITPVVRSFISIPAGVFEAKLARYVILTAVGSAIWSFAWAGAGWGLGASWSGVNHGFAYVEYAVVAGIVLFAAYLILRRYRSITMARRAPDSSR